MNNGSYDYDGWQLSSTFIVEILWTNGENI